MTVNLFDPNQFGFADGSPIFDYPPNAKKLINEASLRVQGSSNYVQFWDRVLDAGEREKLGGDVDKCAAANSSCIDLLCKLRTFWIRERAVAEIAHKLGCLATPDYEWIRQLIGDKALTAVGHPKWNCEAGTLEYDGKLCRRIFVRKATKIVPVLDQFEEAGWSPSIKFLSQAPDPQEIHQVCRKLNAKLNHISFHADGMNITWAPTGN